MIFFWWSHRQAIWRLNVTSAAAVVDLIPTSTKRAPLDL
jgi:hypothetical protein